MEIYLVGGAVRDELLGLPVKERDWVVVGATPEKMLDLGYKPVGKDFPVFLHPKTHEEYALARTERKVSKGYAGFKFYADPNVTLEDDLKRRDLTINAIAKTQDGKLIDPYNGVKDLKNKILRHVSEAFAEDPVRILRIGRFAAKFSNFTVHPDTIKLMQVMVEAGEVDALVSERVWQELYRTLNLPSPQRFFEVLKECDALPILFPEISTQFACTLEALQKITQLSIKNIIIFAVLTSCLTEAAIRDLCGRYRVPSMYRDLALLVARYKNDFSNVLDKNSEQILTLLEQLDAFRRPKRFDDFLLTCEICAPHDASLQAQKLRHAYQVAIQIPIQPLLDLGLQGEAINKELHVRRVRAIKG